MYVKRLTIILLALTAILTTAACSSIIRGSGELVTESRQVRNFDRISLEGMGEVQVTQDGRESLSIETDDNIMEYVKADVEGRTLKLGLKEGVSIFNMIFPSRLIFTLGVDDLNGVSISGSGDIEAGLIETDQLEVLISGSGKVQISNLTAGEVIAEISGSGEVDLAGGETAEQDISISGSGKYLAGDLCSAAVQVSVSGSGTATVCADETLEADISGSGSINYYGRPSLRSSSSGSGSINNLGEK